MWMNTYEVDEAADRLHGHPVLGKATRFLAAYRDEVNAHSDGWAYWHVATRAAGKLMTLIDQGMTAARHGERPIATEADLRAAITPIKSFYTRRGNNAGMRFPSEILNGYKITTYRNGRATVHKFTTLDDARKVASEIFDKTGVVVGIEAA